MKYGLGDRGHGDRGQRDLQKLRRKQHEGKAKEESEGRERDRKWKGTD